MGKRVIAAVLLLVLLVVSGIWSHRWLEAFCAGQTALVEQGRAEEAYRSWQKTEPWIACLVGHEELNQAGDCYAELLATPPENREPITRRLLYWFWAIAEYDRPSLRSLL